MEPKHTTVLKEIYLSLFNDRKVTTQIDFAKKIKFGSTPVSQMITGKKPMPIRLLKVLYKKYGINSNYLITDGKEGPMYMKDLASGSFVSEPAAQNEASETVSLKKEIEFLKKVIQDKEKIIQLLEKDKP